ncbi:MAG: T9SS type A sorting domain-containing protein, partial [Bacteroidetes bacterium]|nr:T9SS type A sorting domain-containing protein [Bacteroidota bacterium]
STAYKASVMTFDSVFTSISEPRKQEPAIFPNPATRLITVDFPNIPSGTGAIEIMDIRGAIFYQKPVTGSRTTVNVENYPAGIYLVRVTTAKSSFTGKFWKE